METFGSSLVFVWLKLWHWFGYSLVTVQEFGLSKWLPSMPLVVRGWAASLRAIPHFGIETTHEEEYQKCNSVGLWSASGTGRWGLWLVTTSQVCDSVTPPWPADDWQLCGSGFSTGMTGVRGQREGSQGAGTHIGTWEDQQQYLSRAPRFFFKAREGLHIHTFFPLSLFLFRGFGPVFEKKSFWGINT